MQNKLFSWFFSFICKLIAMLPLSTIHKIGAFFGWLFHSLDPKTKSTLVRNIKQSGIFTSQRSLSDAVKANVQEMGKAMLESIAIWGSSQSVVLSKIKAVRHFDLIQDAVAQKRGIIFLTPHIGAFEVASIYYAAQYPMTILYRPTRKLWMNDRVLQGRAKGHIKLAPTTVSGVKKLYLALKQGEAVGILPDQIASKGEGEWANFFGKPVYTMVLASKLAKKTGAIIIMAVAERLPKGQGFILHLERLSQAHIANASALNQQIEQQVRKFPLQYMWSYDRYKQP